MKNKTLLIMAAGMGSRFGGLKQIEPVGPNNEFIIDYSIYDAIRFGFNKVVFIIKKENYDLFKKTVGRRIERKIPVEYVFQDLSDIPDGYTIPNERIKPLGTAHAIYAARNVIKEQFMIINADDFYGYEAFKEASTYMDISTKQNEIGLVCYEVINTLTKNGSVKRGVCYTDKENLLNIDESSITISKQIEAISLKTGYKKIIAPNTKVSMNMMTFYPNIFEYIEKELKVFLNKRDILKDEFLISNVISKANDNNDYIVKIINTESKWVGVTYREDKEEVVKYIKELINQNIYPIKLWNN